MPDDPRTFAFSGISASSPPRVGRNASGASSAPAAAALAKTICAAKSLNRALSRASMVMESASPISSARARIRATKAPWTGRASPFAARSSSSAIIRDAVASMRSAVGIAGGCSATIRPWST